MPRAVVLAMALFACSGDERGGLVVVQVAAPQALPDVETMEVRIGTRARSFATGGSLSPTPIAVGVYTPASLSGRQRVTVSAPPTGCPRWSAEAEVDAPVAGVTVEVRVDLVETPCAGGVDAGAGGQDASGGGGGGSSGEGGAAGGVGGRPSGAGGAAGAAGAGGMATGIGGNAGAIGGQGGSSGGMGGAAGPVDPPSLQSCQELDHAAVACNRATGAGDFAVQAVAFSPNGALLASGGDDGRVKLWKPSGKSLVADGRVLSVQGRIYALVFSPDGTRLFVGYADGGLRAFALPAGSIEGDFAGHTEDVIAVAPSPDGTRLVSLDRTSVRVWSIADRKTQKTIAMPNDARGRALVLSPAPSAGSLWAAVGRSDGSVLLRDVTAAEDASAPAIPPSQGQSQVTPEVTALAFSGDGKTLYVGDIEGMVIPYDLSTFATPKKLTTLLSSWPQTAQKMAVAPDDRFVAVATASPRGGGQVRLFRRMPQEPLAATSPTYTPASIAYAPDGRALFAGEYACGKVLYCRD